MAFIDCNEQISAGKSAWPERPHCEHGDWVSNGSGWASPTLSTWQSIKRRTVNWSQEWANDPRRASQKYEGVKVAWNSFQEFVSEMGRRPSREHTIDRIDPEGDYTTENCQWLLGSLNYSKGGRTRARQRSEAMIDRMQAELQDLETELLKEGIEINE